MTLSLLPRMAAPLRLAARAAAPAAAPSAGILTRWAASAATPTPAPGALVTGSTTAGPSYATTATSSARNAPVANLQGAQPIADGGVLAGVALVVAQVLGPGRDLVALAPALGLLQVAGQCPASRAVAPPHAAPLGHDVEKGVGIRHEDPVLDRDGDRAAARSQVEFHVRALPAVQRVQIEVRPVRQRHAQAENGAGEHAECRPQQRAAESRPLGHVPPQPAARGHAAEGEEGLVRR